VTRTIASYEYLFGGLVFTFVGLMAAVSGALHGSGSGSASPIPIWAIVIPFAALLIGIGIYWLWRFEQVLKVESALHPTGRPKK
jgi:hypothetical protein